MLNLVQDADIEAYGFGAEAGYEERWVCSSSGSLVVEYDDVC